MAEPYTFKATTEYGSMIEVCYATLRAATRLDRVTEVGEDRIIVKDDGTYDWEIEVYGDTKREAREALETILTRFPAIALEK